MTVSFGNLLLSLLLPFPARRHAPVQKIKRSIESEAHRNVDEGDSTHDDFGAASFELVQMFYTFQHVVFSPRTRTAGYPPWDNAENAYFIIHMLPH